MRAALAAALSLVVCVTASAQTPPDSDPARPEPAQPRSQPSPVKPRAPRRTVPLWFISGDVAAQPIRSFTDTVQTPHNQETQTVVTEYAGGTGVMGSGTVALLWHRMVGTGVAVSRFSRGGTAHVDASVPHPFYYNQPRHVTGDARDLTRAETGVHLLLLYLPKPRPHLRLVFSGGPSYLNVEQEVVEGVRYAESYPYDTAAFTGVTTRRVSGSALGLNAAVDVIWMVNARIGAGGLLRYTYGAVDLPTTDGRGLSVTAGGVQAGAGLRIFF